MQTDFSQLRKFLVPEFVFGEGAMHLASKYIKRFQGTKVFLVTDKGVTEAGWVKLLEEDLRSENINYILFDDITPNPKDDEVMNGAEILKREKCDIVLAIGGGSPMDCAKAISIVSTNNVSVEEFEGIDEVKIPGLPLICIPTTAGTSADISQFAIINKKKDFRKFAIISKLIVPDVALIDPRTTTTMNPKLTAETGMDAFVHAIEAYVSNVSSPITDINALKAIELIIANLPCAYNEPGNMFCRKNMMLASLLAGFAFSNASLGLVHSMAHSLGGSMDFAHGECNSLLLESVIEFNFDSAPEKYSDIARLFNVNVTSKDHQEIKNALKDEIKKLKKSIGINYTLKDIGLTKNHIKQLAEKAIMDGCLATNPKLVSLKSIEECYYNAL
jgi:alcohol dehydrogenase class IV